MSKFDVWQVVCSYSTVPCIDTNGISLAAIFGEEINTDHMVVCSSLKFKLSTPHKQFLHTLQVFTKLSNLSVASPSDDIDEFWRSWQRSILSVMRNCIPRRSVPYVRSNTPWINKDIRSDIARRERYYKWYKSSHLRDVLVKFKSLRNLIVSKIRTACEKGVL